MPDVLWLVFERVPHPDAVSYPADQRDALLVLQLLDVSPRKRVHLAEQFRNFQKQIEKQPVFERPQVPVRGVNGLYQLVNWRFAKWLSHILPACESTIESTRTRVESWLNCDRPRSHSSQGTRSVP